jgi:carboxyl-terminal processing protease
VRIKKVVAPSLLVVLSAALLIQLPLAIADRASGYDVFDPIIDVRHILVDQFVDPEKLNDEEMRVAMIEGMIETLDDPHTMYVPPAEHADFEKELRGTYVGIGCEVNIVNDYLTIVSPMDGSPALEAGIMAGDIVLEIEGHSTLKLPIQECIDKLMGEPGTPVRIKVRHLDGNEQTYDIKRGKIITRTVKGIRRDGENWNYCIDGDLGLAYIRVTQFNNASVEEFRTALDKVQQRGLNGLVLDLRDNPGGELNGAVQMADLFLTEGTVVSIRPRPGRGEPVVFTAQRAGTLPDFPMIVLVNGQSASASEIVAGALQENGRAKVMGARSFGKGSVQEVRELEYNRGTLKFTTAHYHLPSGRNINRAEDSVVWGVDPDPGMVVPVSDDQYIEMFRARRDFEVIRASNGDSAKCVASQWIRDTLKDEQLAKAVETLSACVQTGSWPAVTQQDSGVVAFDLELSRTLKHRGELIEALDRLEQRIGELNKLSAEAGKTPLLPPDVSVVDGTLTIRDKQGNVVGTYKIQGGDIELALETLDLKPLVEESK